MVIIPLYIFLFIFFGVLLIISVFYFISISHLFTTANLTIISFIMTLIVSILIGLTLYGTWHILRDTNWQQSVKIFDMTWFGNNNQFGE